jgi:hypothetical protein
MTTDGIASVTWRPGPSAGGRPPEIRVPGHTDRIAATFHLMTALLEGAELTELLTIVAERARHMSGARLVFMALPGEVPNTLTLDFANGVNADQVRGVTVRVGTSAIGRAFLSRRALSMRVATDPALKGLPPGPILLLPLDTGERTCGILALAGRPGDIPFSPPVKRQLLIFATTSATLIELGEEHRAARRG